MTASDDPFGPSALAPPPYRKSETADEWEARTFHRVGFLSGFPAEARIWFLRLVNAGWEFGLHGNPLAVCLRTGDGKTWHTTTADDCSCPARIECRHRRAVRQLGGIAAVRRMIGERDDGIF